MNVVQEKAKLDRSSSQRAAANSSQAAPPPPRRAQPQPNVDLFGDDTISAPPRPNTTEPPASKPSPSRAEPAPPRQTRPGDSLLGLDFFGGAQAALPDRPSSSSAVSSTSSVPSRPDLKQSILSLYASAPKPAVQPQPQAQSFGSLQSPPLQSTQQPQQPAFGGLNDAFSGLSFSSPPTQQPPKPSPFAGLTSVASPRSTPAAPQTTSTSAFGSGGSFFDTASKPIKPTSQQPPAAQRTFSSSSGFGDFLSATSPVATAPPLPSSQNHGGDLFDLSIPSQPPAPPPKPANSTNFNSAFNLSAPAPQTKPRSNPQPAAVSNLSSGFSTMDAWGSNDVWSTPDTSIAPKPAAAKSPPVSSARTNDFGWDSSTTDAGFGSAKPAGPTISADEDFGGWRSAAPVTSATTQGSAKPVGGFSGEDLFSNVWE